VLEADARIIQNWVTTKKSLADTWVSHSEIRRLTQQLVEISEASQASSARDELLRSTSYQPLVEALQRLKRQRSLSAVNIFSRFGTCLVHTRQEMVGAPVAPAGGAYLRRVMLGETIFVKPTKEKLYVVGFDPHVEGAVIGIAAPIRDQHGVVIGGLALGFPLECEYTESLAFTRSGITDEAYAFDEDFMMLSRPDRPQVLVEKGVLSEVSAAGLNVQVRVPQRSGNTYTVSGQPPTLMATAAVEHGGGINLDGYPNYLGETVIGASRWLKDLGFGICTELAVDEAFRPVHTVERLTLGLLGLTGLVAGLAIYTTFRNVRLYQTIQDQRRIGPYILG
jgi:hypothetical protein